MADDTLVGKNLGQYEIMSLLGRGLFSAVYRAFQASLNRTVAVKVLPADFLRDAEFMPRFEREVRQLMLLEDYHILPIYDVGKAGDRPFIAMRYMAGGTLGNMLARYGHLSVAEAVPIAQQVAAALDHAHQHGILHRDLKPSNILLDAEGTAYVSDFGVTRLEEAITALTGSGITGGITYAPPEMLGGGKKLGPQADVYSLAAILFQMLNGRAAFQAETAVETAKQILSEEPTPLRTLNPEVPEAVEAVIMKGLSKNPKDRQPTAGALASAFSQAAGVTANHVKRGLPPADETGSFRHVPPSKPLAPFTPPPGTLKAIGRTEPGDDDVPTPAPSPALQVAPPPPPPPPTPPSPGSGGMTPLPGSLMPQGKHSTGTGSAVTPLLRSSSTPSGSFALEKMSPEERREFQKARRKVRRRQSGGIPWYSVLLAFVLVVVAWFVIGLLAGQWLREREVERKLAEIWATQTPAAGTAYVDATGTARAGVVVPPVEPTDTPTEAESSAVPPTSTSTSTPTPREPTRTPTSVPTDTPTSQPTVAGGSQGGIAFVSERDGDPEIFLLDLATGDQHQVTRNTVLDGNPDWSADGTLLAFDSAATGSGQHIFVVNADGSNQEEITRGIRVDTTPLWSALENVLIFHSSEAGRSFIRTIDLEGNEETLVQIPSGDNHLHDWSPDAMEVTYFGFSPAGTLEMLRLDIATDVRTPLTRNNGSVQFATYSQDRSQIVFTQFVTSTQRAIFIADNDPACTLITDCNTRRVTNDEFSYATPRFSPDGTMILASSNENGNLDLVLLDLEGNVLQFLTDSSFDDYDGDWQPASQP